MSYGIEACALALLRADPEVAVPVSRLHHALLHETGPVVGPRAPLQERLRRRPDLFILLEPRPAPWDIEEWPERLRQEYRTALREAGLAPELRVVPRALGPADEDEAGLEQILRQVNSSLVDLWDATEGDTEARSQVADALSASSALQNVLCGEPPEVNSDRASPERDRPTTPPRDPRREG
jgi:hypothetical protein